MFRVRPSHRSYSFWFTSYCNAKEQLTFPKKVLSLFLSSKQTPSSTILETIINIVSIRIIVPSAYRLASPGDRNDHQRRGGASQTSTSSSRLHRPLGNLWLFPQFLVVNQLKRCRSISPKLNGRSPCKKREANNKEGNASLVWDLVQNVTDK